MAFLSLERWQLPSFVSLIDRPAREALTRSQAGVLPTLAPALVGLGLAALTTLAGLVLGGRPELLEPVIRALMEGLLLALPVLLVVATVAMPTLSPTTTLSIFSVSVGVAGVSATLVLPLVAFLRSCADGSQPIARTAQLAECLMAPSLFLLAVTVVLSRALSAFEASTGQRLAWLFGLLSFSVFVMRLSPAMAGG